MRSLAVALFGTALAAAFPVPKGAEKKPDAERFVGAWETVVSQNGGQPHTKARWTFDDKLIMTSNSGGTKWTIKLNPERTPREIDITDYKGIYEFDGDEIKIAYRTDGFRPADFTPQIGTHYCVLRRVDDRGK